MKKKPTKKSNKHKDTVLSVLQEIKLILMSVERSVNLNRSMNELVDGQEELESLRHPALPEIKGYKVRPINMSLHDREVLVREEIVQVLKANEEEFEASGLEKDYIIGFKDGKNQAVQNIARVLEIDLSDNLTS